MKGLRLRVVGNRCFPWQRGKARFGLRNSGFRAWGSGFRVQGSGFKVKGLWVRV